MTVKAPRGGPRTPASSTGPLFRFLIGGASAVVVLAGVKLASSLIVLLLLAGFIALVTAPLVLWLRRHRVPAAAAVAIALVLDLAVITAIGSMLVHSLVGFEDRLPVYARQVDAAATTLGVRLSEAFSATSLVAIARSVLASSAAVISDLVLVLLVVTFMLLEVTGLNVKLASLVTTARDLERFHVIARHVNRYLVIKFVASALTGVLAGAICVVAGIELPLVWGLLAFLLNFIPTVGSVVAAVPPTLLALAQHGVGIALLVLFGYICVNLVVGNFLEPRVLGRTLGLSPLVVLLAMIVWGWLLGPVGAVLAVPLTTVIKITADGVPGMRWVGIVLGTGEDITKPEPPT